MPTLICPSIPSRRRREAFTLIELLVVVAIMTFFVAVSVPTFSSVGASGFNKATTKATDLLEVARSYAVANNTYTWVAFHTVEATGSQPAAVYVALLSSLDGTSQPVIGSAFGSQSTWPQDVSVSPNAATGNCQLIHKIESFTRVGFADSGSFPLSSLPAVSQANAATSSPSFSLVIPGQGVQNFDRAIQFTPSGEAKVQATITPSIEFDLYQVNGTVASKTMAAVMRLNGYTGQAQVYLP